MRRKFGRSAAVPIVVALVCGSVCLATPAAAQEAAQEQPPAVPSQEQMQAYFTQSQMTEFLDSIRTAASRAARIVTNMLGFSRRAEHLEQVVFGAGCCITRDQFFRNTSAEQDGHPCQQVALR